MMAAIMLISGTKVLAANSEEVTPSILAELNAYGILQGDEDGDFHLEDAATRAEFSAMLTRTLKVNNISISAEQTFTDVHESDWFYNDVYNLVYFGVISGYTDGTFRPNATLTPNEAVKMMVAALGYTQPAQNRGGYPTGYMNQANDLKLLRGINFGSVVTRANLARLIYNAMDVQLMEESFTVDKFFGSTVVDLKPGDKCLRDLHLQEDSGSALIKGSGIVEANAETWLYKPYNNLEANQVVIDGQIYEVGQTDAYNYLGMEVDFFASDDNSLINIVPTKNNEKVMFTEREYDGCSGSIITGVTDGKTNKYRLENNFLLIKNMSMVQFPQQTDFDISRGTVTAIDNDGNGRYDIVFIEEFESALIERVNEYGIWMREGTVRGASVLPISDDAIYYITNSDGDYIDVVDIEPYSVVSVSSNNAGTVYKIRVCTEQLTGTVERKGKDYIVIDGRELQTESGVGFNVSAGDKISCYCNFRGEASFAGIFDFTDNYAYVAEVAREGGGSAIYLQLVLPGNFIVDQKTDLEDEDAAAIPILKAHNQDVRSFKLSNKVSVNGASLTAENAAQRMESLVNPVIRFKTNSAGEIRAIDEPEIIGEDIFDSNLQRTYNGNELIFGGLSMGAFGVLDETKALCIPDSSGVTMSDDYLASVEMVNTGKYTVNGYDALTDSNDARLIVLQTALRYNSDYGLDENKVAVLENISVVSNEDNEVKAELTFWSQNKKQTLMAEPEVVSDMQNGDVFLYSLGVTNDEIAEVERIANLKDKPYGTVTIPGGVSSRYATYAIPVKVEYDRILDAQVRRADIVTVKTRLESENETEFNVFRRNPPPVYIYDTRSKEDSVRLGTIADLMTGGMDDVFFYSSAQKIRICVIVR